MKSFIVTLLILGAIFLGYDYYLVPPKDRVIFERPASPAPAVPTSHSDSAPLPRETAVSSLPASPPSITSSTPAAEPAKPENTAPAFQPPQFDSIEVVTHNWTTMPKSAFPRTVKLLEDTKFTLAIGSTTLHAGAEVTALSLENGLLLVAQNEKSPIRKTLPPEATDFKSRITAGYEEWKSKQIRDARSHFEAQQLQPKPVVTATASTIDASGKPERAVDGTYPLLLERMRRGDPSEITPSNVIHWGNPTMETVKGKATWIIPVTYKARTPFGETDAETLAHVQNGKVVSWLFKGSGEPVP